MSRKSIVIAIIEDDPALADQVRGLLEREADLHLKGCFSSGEEALRRVPELKPDVVLVDLGLPGMKGAECMNRLRHSLPGTQFVILTVREDSAALFDSLMAGATGYLSKRTDMHRVAQAIREVAEGGSPMSAGIARKAIQLITQGPPCAEEACLSERERQVLELLARGSLYKEAAHALGIHIDTVRNHVRKIYEKLQARNRSEAVLKYRGLRP